MASLASDGRLIWTIDGVRKQIRLGHLNKHDAHSIKLKVQRIISAKIMGVPLDAESSKWIADLPDAMHKKFAATGLFDGRERTAATLGKFLEDYFDALTVKDGTEVAYGHCKRNLIEFFGETKAMRSIGPTDAEKFKQYLKEKEKLSAATVSRRVSVARMLFKRAGKWGLIDANPFADVVAGSQQNKSRLRFITREDVQKVMDAAPDAEWRLLIALSRYGGLRTPSESLLLKWSDVNWGEGDNFKGASIRVTSPKTEHHQGGGERIVPMFPELREPLRQVYDAAEVGGSEFVITRYRDPGCNLRTQLMKIIRRAGLKKPWPKLWHNMRATRQTELAGQFPLAAVCAWIGNSKAVALGHYLQVTDGDFERAVAGSPIAPVAPVAIAPVTQAPTIAPGTEGGTATSPKY